MMRFAAALLPVALAGVVVAIEPRLGVGAQDLQNLWPLAIAASAATLIWYRDPGSPFLDEARGVEERFVKRLDEVTVRVREALHDGEQLRRSLDRSSAMQQAVLEKGAAAADAAVTAAATLARRDDEALRLHAEQARSAMRDSEAYRTALMDAHGSLCLAAFVSQGETSAVTQLRRELEVGLRRLGIEVLGEIGSPVDGALHNVVDSCETDDPNQDGSVGVVRKAGFTQGGSVLRRADVVENICRPQPELLNQDPPTPESEAVVDTSQVAPGSMTPTSASDETEAPVEEG